MGVMFHVIEVGECVGFVNGRIIKCTNSYLDKIISNHAVYKNRNIVKHSKNIIDLIGAGDFVETFFDGPENQKLSWSI